MHTSKLLKLMRSLSPEDMRWLAKFVRSPYYNSNAEVVALFDYIRTYYPACDSRKLEKEHVFKKLLPKEKYTDRRLRLIMFRLSNLIEEFMVAQNLKKDTLHYQKQLLVEFQERGFYDSFEKKSFELSKELGEQSYRDEAYYEAQWQLKRDLLFHSEKPRFQITAADLTDAVNQLDTAYLMTKLRYSGELLNRQNILSERYDILLLRELQETVATHPDFKDNVVLQVYNDVLILMENILDEATYNRLEKNLTNNLHLFRKADQASLLRYLINCTIQLYNNGKMAYLEHQFHLYKLSLEQDLFLEDGQLPESTFLNIVVTGTVLAELKWVEAFINQHAPMMGINALNLGRAYWHFAKKEFGQSNELLRHIDESGLAYSLRVKSLSLRNHYEMFLQDNSYYDLFTNECRTFEKFIRRSEQITSNRATGYLQFISFLKKLGKLRFSNTLLDNKAVNRLQKELDQKPTIIARRWLMDKLL